MDQASVTVALSFFVAIGLFGLLTLFLIYDDAPVQPSRDRARHDGGGSRAAASRTWWADSGCVVVVVTFLIWSLLISDHLRASPVATGIDSTADRAS